jgi:hypothetical protein
MTLDPLRHVKFFAATKHAGQLYAGRTLWGNGSPGRSTISSENHAVMSKCDHQWVPRPRGEGEFCKRCQDHFPCDARDCGHWDCVNARRNSKHPPTCTSCNKTVDLTEGAISVNREFKYYIKTDKGKPKIICGACNSAL